MEHLADLIKAENPERYKKYAEKGVMVAHPVTIAGNKARPDNGIHYHSTIKYFNPDADHPHEIHNIAKELKLHPPNPKTTQIEPGMFKDRNGDDVYVLKLKGSDAERIKEHNSRFSHMGYPSTFNYEAHVSVDKATHDKIKTSGAKTAHEAGIEFGNAELRHGPNVLATYRHPMIDDTPVEQHDPIVPIATEKDNKKLAASEKDELAPLEKGALKHAAAGAAMLGASLAHSPSAAAPTNNEKPFYDHQTMLDTISDVESSGGQNTNHHAMSGIHHGSKAYGKYGLSPELVKETIRMNPEMRVNHKKVLALQGDTVSKYLQDNPGLEDKIADRHLSRLEHHFGNDPEMISMAWLNGIVGANAAKNKGEDIANHWHVLKAKDAYKKRKGI